MCKEQKNRKNTSKKPAVPALIEHQRLLLLSSNKTIKPTNLTKNILFRNGRRS